MKRVNYTIVAEVKRNIADFYADMGSFDYDSVERKVQSKLDPEIHGPFQSIHFTTLVHKLRVMDKS